MHLFLAIQNLPAIPVNLIEYPPNDQNTPKLFPSIKRTNIYISSNKFVLNRPVFMEVRFDTFPLSWWCDNFLFQFLIISKEFSLSRGIANWDPRIQNNPVVLGTSLRGSSHALPVHLLMISIQLTTVLLVITLVWSVSWRHRCGPYKASGTSFNVIRRHVLLKGLVLALNRGR
jgi:hypothetical protein